MRKTDQDLVTGYRKGDTKALEELIDRHGDSLFGFIIGMTRKRDEAQEIFQETWLKAIKKLDRYKHDNFKGWITRIARNIMIDRSRKHKPELLLDKEDRNGAPGIEKIAGKMKSPAENVNNRQMAHIAGQALMTLPPDQREVFLMRVQQDMPFKEIANIQKVSVNTALARMQYAVQKLRKKLFGPMEEFSQ